MVEVLNRIATVVLGRYRDHYAGEQSFGEKYRADMDDLLTEDLLGGWGKVWLEAVALALNSPELLASFLAEQRLPARRHIEDEILRAMDRNDNEARRDAEGISALLAMVRSGLVIDRLTGASRGHDRGVELLGEFLRGAHETGPRRQRGSEDVGEDHEDKENREAVCLPKFGA